MLGGGAARLPNGEALHTVGYMCAQSSVYRIVPRRRDFTCDDNARDIPNIDYERAVWSRTVRVQLAWLTWGSREV